LQVLAPVNATFAGLSLEGLHETETSRLDGRKALRAGLNLGQHRAATQGAADGQTKRRQGGFAGSGKVQPAERSSEAFRKLE
jgi:hypothetical protein